MAAIPERKLAAIMVADIAGFGALMERDESGTFERVRGLRESLVFPRIAEHNGRVIKTTGDGFLAEFTSATAALQCAISLQRHNHAREQERPAEDRIHMRIGINVGDIIIDGSDVAGDGVVIAARLEPLAPRDGICVSATVREHIRQELGIEYEDLGDQHVKSISRPIRAYRVVLTGKNSVDTKGAAVILPSRRLLSKGSMVGFAVLIVGTAVAVALHHGVISPTPSAMTAAKARHMTFAVVPLSAAEGDTQAAAFASSVTDGVIARQTNSVWNRVVSRESVEAALLKHSSPKDLARALDVRYVIRGRVVRVGDQFMTNLAVIDGATERVLASKDMPWPVSRPFDPERAAFDRLIGYLSGQANKGEREAAWVKNDGDRDVEDLVYIARDSWDHTRAGYDKAMSYLRRAQALDPDGRTVLFLLSNINLCECRAAWSSDPAQQERIGEDAVDRYLAKHPPNRTMLMQKVYLLEIRGRYDDALVILDSQLVKSPGDPDLLSAKAYQLIKSGRPAEALPAILAALAEDNSIGNRLRASATQFMLERHAEAATLAQKATAEMDKSERADPFLASAFLIRAASNANLGRMPQSKAALDDFDASVARVRTISDIRKWMDPRAELAGYEPLYAGLRRAGVAE